MIGIYIFKNKINGKVYIGQSVNIAKRYIKHKFACNNIKSKEYNYPLYVAIRKYGWENFSFEILEECTIEQLNEKEIYYIKKYNSYTGFKNSNGYNMTLGGDTGRQYNYEEAFKLWNSGCGSVEIAKKLNCSISTSRLILYSLGIKDKLENKKRNAAYNNISHKVYQYSLYGKFIAEYRSLVDAAIAVGISKDAIINNLMHKSKEAGGYLWSSTKVESMPPLLNYLTRVIVKLSIDGVELARYKNIIEAAKQNNIKQPSNITRVCKGFRKTCNGFKWKYLDTWF